MERWDTIYCKHKSRFYQCLWKCHIDALHFGFEERRNVWTLETGGRANFPRPYIMCPLADSSGSLGKWQCLSMSLLSLYAHFSIHFPLPLRASVFLVCLLCLSVLPLLLPPSSIPSLHSRPCIQPVISHSAVILSSFKGAVMTGLGGWVRWRQNEEGVKRTPFSPERNAFMGLWQLATEGRG